MADVQPFRGLRYDREMVEDLSLVISPPYDIISPEEQRFYYQRSPYNVVRLELGEELPGDSPRYNKYTRAAVTLESWLKEGVMRQEKESAFYLLEHRFVHRGIIRRRWGLTARLRLEEWGSGRVRPHEVTFKGPTSDRLQLLRSCRVNLSPIWGVVRHQEEGLLSLLPELAKGAPEVQVIDHLGVMHSMWVIEGEKPLARVSQFCAHRVAYIADGHHRYETALLYQRECRASSPSYSGEEPFNFVMITLMDTADPGLVMMPTHRLVRMGNVSRVRKQLSSLFSMAKLPISATLEDLQGEGSPVIGVYGLDGRSLWLLRLQDKRALQEMMPAERSPSWKELEVSILHEVILRHLLGIDNLDKEKECLEYTQDEQEAMRRVDSGEYQIAFLLNPLPVDKVLTVADEGDRMPQKSTYFYPKLPTGLVMNPLWE